MSGPKPPGRRESVKSRVSSQQQRRRDAARVRQRDARRDLTNHARSLALGEDGEGGGGGGGGGGRGSGGGGGRGRGGGGGGRQGDDGAGGGGSRAAGHDAAFSQQHQLDDGGMEVADGGGDDRDRAARGTSTDATTAHSQGGDLLHRVRGRSPPGGVKSMMHRRTNSAPGKWSREGVAEFSEGQFMLPEWMVDVPTDLGSSWYVTPRPSGQRCLVIASRGQTVSRLKTGRVLHRFPSALPGGSKNTRHGRSEDTFCILDCVFHKEDSVYYAMDCLAWNGMSLYDCTTEMRLSWLHSKLGESGPECEAVNPPGVQHRYRFAMPPTRICDAEGLSAAYHAPVPFIRDGLLFVAKDGNYELGVTPLAMLWKDNVCSQYVLETNPDGSTPERQKVVLALRADTGDVVTGDPQPVPLARLPAQFLASAGRVAAVVGGGDDLDLDLNGGEAVGVSGIAGGGGGGGASGDGGGGQGGGGGGGRNGWRGGGGLRDGLLLRFAVGDGGLTMKDGLPVAADLAYKGIANQRRGSGADSMTKILFQYYARREPITIEEIAAAVSPSPSPLPHPHPHPHPHPQAGGGGVHATNAAAAAAAAAAQADGESSSMFDSM